MTSRLLLTIIAFPVITLSNAQEDLSQLVYEEPGKESAYPRLSADSGRILYQSNRNGNWQLFIYTVGTSRHVLLTPDTTNSNFADWSRDNRQIAFVSDRDGNEEIYLIHSDGTGLKRLTNDTSRDIHPYFSPDGKYILFNSTRGNNSLDIYRYNLQSGKIQRLTDTPDDETCARYSPDMKQIVYLKNGITGDDVFILNTSNFLSDNISTTPVVQDGWPAFSPDGKWIYYSSMISGNYCIYRCREGKSEQLTYPSYEQEDARVCIDSKGENLYFNRRTGNTIEIRRLRLPG